MPAIRPLAPAKFKFFPCPRCRVPHARRSDRDNHRRRCGPTRDLIMGLAERVAGVDFPRPGTPGWGFMNRERGELIRGKIAGTLTPVETERYEYLQRMSLAALLATAERG